MTSKRRRRSPLVPDEHVLSTGDSPVAETPPADRDQRGLEPVEGADAAPSTCNAHELSESIKAPMEQTESTADDALPSMGVHVQQVQDPSKIGACAP
jgi:hypothetical protein